MIIYSFIWSRHKYVLRPANVWCNEFMGNVASLSQAGAPRAAWHKEKKERRLLLDGVSGTHMRIHRTGHLRAWTPVPKGLGVNGDGFGDCVRGRGGAWERGCTMESRKTDRRRGGDNRGREVKGLLFRCVSWPAILRSLSVVERPFCFCVVGCWQP